MVVFVLPLPSDHGPGPAVDDVGPPRLRGGVAPGVVEGPSFFSCLRFYKHPPHRAHLCALCSLQQRRGRAWRGSGQHHLSSSRGDLEDIAIARSVLSEVLVVILTFRHWSVFPQSFFVTSCNEPHAAILHPRIVHRKPKRQSPLKSETLSSTHLNRDKLPCQEDQASMTRPDARVSPPGCPPLC